MEEVSSLVTAVEVVTTEVEVLVLVTKRGSVNLLLRTMFWNIYLPTYVEVIVVTTLVVAGLKAVYTEVITVGEVEVQVDGLYFVVVTTLVTG